MSCPRSSRTVSTWSCRGIIQRKYDVIYMSAQKLVAGLHGARLPGGLPWFSVGSSIVAFMSGITEVNSLAAPLPLPQLHSYSDFDADTEKLRLRGGLA